MKLYKISFFLLGRNMQFGGDLQVIMNCLGTNSAQKGFPVYIVGQGYWISEESFSLD